MHADCQVENWHALQYHVGDPHRVMEYTVPLATTLIEKIEFHESIALIYRAIGRREVPRAVYQ